ncbi:hypothetical protein [Novosphingobium sp.]|uniref:hypothetical protein n=1 Tax=Novosphingobium sp. TaxID=1874826 RepID=UPI0035B2D0CD
MEIAITKLGRHDAIAITRADSTRAETIFPKKGPVPHDVVHWFVERELGLSRGFWGMVAAGHHPEELVEIAKAAGHASAKRAGIPDDSIVELLQAERIVECFEADLWSGGGDDADLLALAATACESSHVPLPEIADGALGRIRTELGAFAKEWIAAGEGHVARLEWKDD